MSLNHYDEVRVLDADTTRELEIVGCLGVVLGLAQDDDTSEFYCSVHIDTLGRSVMVNEADLAATGRKVDPTEVYDGTTISVTEDGRVLGDAEEERDL